MTLNALAKEAHDNAVEKGFYIPGQESDIGNLLMQAVAELAEAFEAARRDEFCLPNWVAEWQAHGCGVTEFESVIKNTVEDELADALIIIAGIAHHIGMDIESHVSAKMRYNKTRPRLHGRRF